MANHQREEHLDPRQYLRVINRRKILLILPFLGVVMTVMLGSLFIDPAYESSTTILVMEPRLLSQNVEKIASGGIRERMDALRREITSRDYLIRLIRTLGWDQDPALRARAEKERERFSDLSVEEIVDRWLIGSLRKQIRVQGQGSDLLVITVEDREPKAALLLAKTLAQVFIDETLRRELSGVRGALEFSNEQLAVYKQRLENSEEQLRRFREQMVWKSLQKNVQGQDNLQRVSSLVATAESDLRQAEGQVTSLTIRLQNLSSGPSLSLSDPGLEELKRAYCDGAGQLASQLILYSWRDGRVISLSEQINKRRESFKSELDRLCRQTMGNQDPVYCGIFTELELAKADVIFYRNKRQILSDHVDSFERSLTRGPQDELTLERLKEDVESNRKLYQMFLDQSQGAQIQEAAHRTAAEGRFRIMEPAMLPLKPVKPNQLRLAAVSLVVGLMLGLSLVFVAEFLDHSLSTVEEVERYLGLSVLVTIPRMDLGVRRNRKARLAIVVVLVLLAIILMAIFIKGRLAGT